MFQPLLDENDNAVDRIDSSVKGIDIETLVITNVLVGTFIFRRRDNAHTRQYDILVEHNKIKAEGKTEY